MKIRIKKLVFIAILAHTPFLYAQDSTARQQSPVISSSDNTISIASIVSESIPSSKLAEQYYNNGQVKFLKKQYESAIVDFTRAIEFNPRYRKAYWDLAECKENTGLYEDALKDYTTAIDLYQNDNRLPELYQSRGRCRGRNKEYDLAIADFDKALELNPEYGAVYWNRAVANKKNGDYVKSIDDYNKAISLYKNDKEVLVKLYENRGENKSLLKDYAGALADFDMAISINPAKTSVYTKRATCHATLGKYDKAVDDLSNALSFSKTENKPVASLYYWRGMYRNEQKQYKKAIKDFNNSTKLEPKYQEAYWSKAISYGYLEDYKNAIENYTTAISFYKEDNDALAKLYFWRGHNKTQAKEYKEAIIDFSKVLELKMENDAVLQELGFCYLQLHDTYRALDYLLKALALSPNNYLNYYYLACYYGVINDRQNTMMNLKQALEKGYNNFHNLDKNANLASIRNTSEFKLLIKKYKR